MIKVAPTLDGCRFQVLMTTSELTELERRLRVGAPVVTRRPELPETIWRLTNRERLGAPGYVMTLESEE